jgi:hypothetical protein
MFLLLGVFLLRCFIGGTAVGLPQTCIPRRPFLYPHETPKEKIPRLMILEKPTNGLINTLRPIPKYWHGGIMVII